jgi:hypothetical protein
MQTPKTQTVKRTLCMTCERRELSTSASVKTEPRKVRVDLNDIIRIAGSFAAAVGPRTLSAAIAHNSTSGGRPDDAPHLEVPRAGRGRAQEQ